MTDLTPNDLSHISDDEFIALCLQGEHAPGLEPLSPAAQVVLDAGMEHSGPAFEPVVRRLTAAALRAAALYCKRDKLILLSFADELDEAI